LGRTGGEDDAFFHGMVRHGGTIHFAAKAIVHEAVPKQRESLGFLLRRSFRAGQTHGLITQPDRKNGAIVIPLAKAIGKASLFLALAGAHVIWPARRTRALMRMSLQLGLCSHLLGRHTLELYKS
jgi:succinoglycan biosynthesis protein ExoM